MIRSSLAAGLAVLISVFSFSALASRVTLEGSGFLQKPSAPVAGAEGRVEVQYDRDRRLARFWTLRVHPVLRATTSQGAWENAVLLDPRELNLERERDNRFFRVGFFTPKWEGTDGVNPMDIASVKDFSDPLRTQTKASAGVQAGFSGDAELEVFWIPKQTRSSIPWERSPWYPRRLTLPVRSDEIELRIPDQVDYVIESRDELNKALGNNYGFRWQMHADRGDFALAGFEGAADWPLLQPVLGVLTPISVFPILTLSLPSPVGILPVDYRRRTGAAFASMAAGSWLWRGSFRHDQPMGEDRRLPGWSQQGVFGVEKNLAIGEDQVTLLLQGTWGRRAGGSGLLSIADLFDRSVLWGARWPVGENLSFLASGFYSLRDHSRMSQLDVSRILNDEWTAEFFLQILDGPPESLPGLLADRDRVGLRLIRSF